MVPIEYDRDGQVINYWIGVTGDGQRLFHTITADYHETTDLTASFVYNQISDQHPILTPDELTKFVKRTEPYSIRHVTIAESGQLAVQAHLPGFN